MPPFLDHALQLPARNQPPYMHSLHPLSPAACRRPPQSSDIVRMELLVLDALGWKLLVPTPFSLLALAAQALAGCSGSVLARATDLLVGTGAQSGTAAAPAVLRCFFG